MAIGLGSRDVELIMRRDKSLPTDDFSDPAIYWASVRSAMREKANHNKIESQACFFSAILFSISTPLFIAFGTTVICGKIIPAVLSALVTAITAWLQLRQPQKLWTIYRRAQRELEDEKVKFDNMLAHYGSAENRDKLLAERTAKIAMSVHERWEGLIPDTAALGMIAGSSEGAKDGN
jgi:hypothetical protein